MSRAATFRKRLSAIRWGRWLIALYTLALLASTVVRLLRPPAPEAPRFAERSLQLPEFSGDAPTGRQITLAYLDYTPPGQPDAPVVILLHGSPGSADNFVGLAPLLSGLCPPPGTVGGGFIERPIVCPPTPPARPYRVIAPDMPGFEHSTHTIADYSFRAHSRYLIALQAKLGIAQAHYVGYSMGGGPAFNVYEISPEHVASITLLSSLATQEFELMGDYHLNHLVHGVQLGFFWWLENLTPHFGAFDRLPGVEFSRNFFESDQRPLREFMNRFEKPMLVLHGKEDGQVPPEAAYEHHRIVPQSEMTMLNSGHGMVFGEPELLAPPLLDFFQRVDDRKAATRARAAPERVAEAAKPVAMAKIIGIATFSFYVLLVLAAALSPELGAAFAAVMIVEGRVDAPGTLIACAIGVFLGELLLRAVARRVTRNGLDQAQRSPWRWLAGEASVARAAALFERGYVPAMLSRYLGGARMATMLAAGARVNGFWRAAGLLGLMLLGSALLAPLLTGVAMPLAAWVGPLLGHFLPACIALTAVMLFSITRMVYSLSAMRMRRRLT